ncbi:MAG: DUF2203 domain-containing protein [Thermomicrobiales bacterium]
MDDQHTDPRLFSLDEAREMMPAVREAILDLQQEKNRLDKLRRELRKLTPAMRGNGHAREAQELEDDIHNQIVTIRTGLESVGDAGVLVKDIDMGLVDFPSLRDGRVVYLCWIIDEPDIAYWHDVDAGFQGRRPL